eukprot:913628-Prorocentrum_minimum.AAC.1
MPRQLSSALFASGTVPLTPTMTTCTVSTTFHPAARSARTSGLSEVHASSHMRTLTALRTPSCETDAVTGPSGGSAVSGHPSSITLSGCTPPIGGSPGCTPP